MDVATKCRWWHSQATRAIAEVFSLLAVGHGDHFPVGCPINPGAMTCRIVNVHHSRFEHWFLRDIHVSDPLSQWQDHCSCPSLLSCVHAAPKRVGSRWWNCRGCGWHNHRSVIRWIPWPSMWSSITARFTWPCGLMPWKAPSPSAATCKRWMSIGTFAPEVPWWPVPRRLAPMAVRWSRVFRGHTEPL